MRNEERAEGRARGWRCRSRLGRARERGVTGGSVCSDRRRGACQTRWGRLLGGQRRVAGEANRASGAGAGAGERPVARPLGLAWVRCVLHLDGSTQRRRHGSPTVTGAAAGPHGSPRRLLLLIFEHRPTGSPRRPRQAHPRPAGHRRRLCNPRTGPDRYIVSSQLQGSSLPSARACSSRVLARVG